MVMILQVVRVIKIWAFFSRPLCHGLPISTKCLREHPTYLRDLVAPDAPRVLFERLTGVLTAPFEPKLMVIAERFHFHKSVQATGGKLLPNSTLL